MKGRKPTADESRWMSQVADMGCIVCRNEFNLFSPASIHHINGKTKEGAHFDTLPLCPQHHQHGGYGVALHAGRVEWERRYGTQQELKKQVEALLGEQ